jgi:CTP:molybdopterin cytidylyltransferase MocA
MSCGGRRGNPCVFPKTCFDELCRLTGDRGGRAVIEGNGHPLILFEAAEAELADIDTPEDLIQSHN